MGSTIYALGLDIGGTQIRVATGTAEGIISSCATRWPAQLSPHAEVQFIAELAGELIRTIGLTSHFIRAGISLAAQIDADGRVVNWPNRPAWRNLHLRPLLEDLLYMPVFIEDDANTAALAEWTFGAAQGYQHALIVMVGTGVGAGLVLNGHLFRGYHGWAGELGHLVVQPDGPLCSCGQRGCVQALASGHALERAALEHGLNGVAALHQAAAQGEQWASDACARSAHWLGLAIANVVNLLDLELVVIGGGVSRLGEFWWTPLAETFAAHLLNGRRRNVPIQRAHYPETAGLLGAISLALQHPQAVATGAGGRTP